MSCEGCTSLPVLPVGTPHERARVAIRWGNRTVRYGELDSRIKALALILEATQPETVLGIRIGNEPAFVVAYLACLAAKRTVVLLDPLWTSSELRYAASEVNLAVLIETELTGEGALACDIFGARQHVLESSGDPVGAFPELQRMPESESSDFAVVYWSSGSTGRPKPIAVPEAALAFRVGSLIEAIGLGPGDRTLCILPLSHCHGIECLTLPTLFSGSELVLADPRSAEPNKTAKLIGAAQITFFSALPKFYASLLEGSIDPSEFHSLRLPFCGSAALDPEVARGFKERFGVRIEQGYGLTEIGVISLTLQSQNEAPLDSVGRVLAGIEWRIEAADSGGAGELWVRSAGLISGGERIHEGWLRTEDLVCADADEFLFVRGRISTFINVNGSKADGLEIERVIAALPWVDECAVAGAKDEHGVERIVAYVVLDEGHDQDQPRAAVRLCVAESLSLFKVPAEVVLLAGLPRSSLGKVLYADLPEAIEQRSLAPESATLLKSDFEREVGKVWCAVLNVASIGAHDSFMDSGGTSVLLVDLQSRLKERFEREFALADFFRYPTVAMLAEALEKPATTEVVDEARERGRRQREAALKAEGRRRG